MKSFVLVAIGVVLSVAPWLRDVASWLRDEYDHSQCGTQTCNSLSHPIGVTLSAISIILLPHQCQKTSQSAKAMFSVKVTTKYWEHTLHGHAVTVLLLTVALLVVVDCDGIDAIDEFSGG
jgi:hypothetical protein